MNAKVHAQTDGKPKKTTNPIYLMGGKKIQHGKNSSHLPQSTLMIRHKVTKNSNIIYIKSSV